MRILRGQSNLEVSSKGFALFVVGLVLATFIGGAVRTVLNSAQFNERLASEIKSRFPKHEFQIGRTELMLSRGIWPALGVRVRDLTFKQEVCGKLSFILNFPQATLPVSLLSLVRGKLRLADVEIDGGGIHLDYKPCVAQPSAEGAIHGGDENRAREFTMPKFDFRQAANVLNGLDLRNFAVTYEKNPTWKLILNSAYLGLGEDMALIAHVDVQKSLPFGTLSHPLELHVHGDHNVLHWIFKADFKEGHVQFDGSVDLNNQASIMKAGFRQVPLKDLSNEMYLSGLTEREFNFKAMWLSCALKWEGKLNDYEASPVNIRDCRVEGSYGHAELETADLWLSGPELFKTPARLRITKLQIGPAAEALKREILPAVIPRLGVWSGVLEYSSDQSWALDGVLENLEIVFSNQSMMGKQIVDGAYTVMKRSGGKTVAKLDTIKLRDGEFEGSVDFDFAGQLRDGTFRAHIEKLSFNPQIQRLLVGGTIGKMKGAGQGTLSAGELSQWSGNVSIPEIKGEGWSSEDLQVRSRLHGGSFEIDGTVKKFRVSSSWNFYPQLRVMRGEVHDTFAWQDISAKLDIHKAGGTLRELRGQEEGGGVWRMRGNWQRDGFFNAILGVAGGKRPQNYSLRGEKGSLSVDDRSGDVR